MAKSNRKCFCGDETTHRALFHFHWKKQMVLGGSSPSWGAAVHNVGHQGVITISPTRGIVLWLQYNHAVLQKYNICWIKATDALFNLQGRWNLLAFVFITFSNTAYCSFFVFFCSTLSHSVLFFFFDSPSLRSPWMPPRCLPPTHWTHSGTPSVPRCRGKSSLTPSGAQIDSWRDATAPPTVQSRLVPLLTSDSHLPLISVVYCWYLFIYRQSPNSFLFLFLSSMHKGSATMPKKKSLERSY